MLSLISMFGLFVMVVAGAYLSARLMGKHYSRQASPANQIKIIDKLDLGRDRFMMIIQTGGKTLLVGVTTQRVETLAELAHEELASLPETVGGADFFRIWKDKLQKFTGAAETRDTTEFDGNDERQN